MDELHQARRGRRRLRSDDTTTTTSSSFMTTSLPSTTVVSAAETAATLEFLDELGEFLELEQLPLPPRTASALEPIPFENGYGSSQSSPMLGCGFTEQQQLDKYPGGEEEESAVVVKPMKKQKKSSTQRQKEELAYLRTKVGQLERELKDMKIVFYNGPSPTQESQDADGALSSSSVATHSRTQSSPSIWETMAQRQLREKNRAELENAQLREAMEAQLKVAKGLERMLRKRQVRVSTCGEHATVIVLTHSLLLSDLGRNAGSDPVRHCN